MSRIPFPLRSGPAPFKFMGEPRLMNCYPQEIGQEQKSPVGFLSIPGQTTFSSVSDVPSRGTLYVEELGYLYSLHLSTLYKVDSTGTATAIPGVVPGSLPAIMARNQATATQVIIITDAAAFALDAGALYLVSMPDGGVPNSVAIYNRRAYYGLASGKLWWSDVDNVRSIDGLAFTSVERAPDALVRVFDAGGELWVFKKLTIEIYTDSDDADLPIQPLGGAFIPKGCAARDSVVMFDNAPHWVGHDDQVYRGGGGYSASRVSDDPVEAAIKSVFDKTTIKGYVDFDGGHTFYVLTCDQWTWVLDAATGTWCERSSYLRPDWRAWPFANAFGLRIVGDKGGGTLRQLSNTVYDEVGDPIVSFIETPDISAYPYRLMINELDIDLNTGAGLGGVVSGTLGYDPQLMTSWSDDGGYTWSSERWSAIGREGQYLPGVTLRGLGATGRRGRRFKFAISDPVPRGFALGDIRADQSKKSVA